ncbi:MAG: hypothetical protein R6U98_07385 [Pirellulaceae bacterium]
MHWRWGQATTVLAVSIPLLWSFGSIVTGTRICAYRDTAHFYYPLYAWISRCWSRGEIPFWNPQDNIGMPVVAEATSAVFYPGKLLFALPLPYPLEFNLYLVAHVVLAAAGAYALARQLLAHQRVSRNGVRSRDGTRRGSTAATNRAAASPGDDGHLRHLAAGLCAVAYAFSGTVLFQYCNVVFLVGAAWLPWALLATDRMLTQRRLAWALVLGICLALMVLGGDPQMAYHTGILAALLAWLRRGRPGVEPASEPVTPPVGRASEPVDNARPPVRRHALFLLLTAALAGILLSAVQIVPAVSWTQVSDRVASQDSDSLWQDVFGTPRPGTHRKQRYHFSVAPWRVLECLWPNVSGHMFPVNRRWLSALGAEDRIWTPTLYIGLMPLLIALSVWRVRTRDRHVQWLSLVAIGSLVASFGWYGLGWIAGEVQSVFAGGRSNLLLGEPTGGLYWLMVKLLPGYGYFRYPAKLWVVTSLAVSLLAGLGLERSLTADRGRIRRVLGAVGTASLVAGVVFAILGVWWSKWFAEVAPDDLFGPLDSRGAWRGCLLACARTVSLCALFWWLLRKTTWAPLSLAQLILLVTAMEMAWANGSHVATAQAEAIQTPSMLSRSGLESVPQSPARALRVDGGRSTARDSRLGREDTNTNQRLTATPPVHIERIYRPPRRRWVPEEWLKTASRTRCEATVRWDRATLFPKFHLLGELGSIHTFSTMRPRDHIALMRFGDKRHPDPMVLDLLGVRYLVLPADARWPDGVPLASNSPEVANVRVWENPNAMPRAWIVHHVEAWTADESVEPVKRGEADESFPVNSSNGHAVQAKSHRNLPGPERISPGTAGIEQRLRRLLSPEDGPRDFGQEAVVESRKTIPAVSGTGVSDTCRILQEGANRLEVEASLASPGLLVVGNRYDPGWSVDVTSEGCSFRPRIVRANVVMQGVFLPAGTHRLLFRYAPRGFHAAAVATVLGWLLCLPYCCIKTA